MKDFNSLSGPWTGQSIQDGFRLNESMRLLIEDGFITGTGTDVDGDFEVRGRYFASDGRVELVRRYTRAPKNPSQVGYPFDYAGKWDGQLVFGRWSDRGQGVVGGPFEMWPDREEDRMERAIELEIRELSVPRG